MVGERRKDAWSHTSSMMALTANVHRDPKKHRPYKPKDFVPCRSEEHEKPTTKTKDLSILKAVFVDKERSAP
jgi:hypothetical protein